MLPGLNFVWILSHTLTHVHAPSLPSAPFHHNMPMSAGQVNTAKISRQFQQHPSSKITFKLNIKLEVIHLLALSLGLFLS